MNRWPFSFLPRGLKSTRGFVHSGEQGAPAESGGRWLRVGLRGRWQRWQAGATVLALGTACVIALIASFASYDHQVQNELVASRAGGEMLSAMLSQEAAVRSAGASNLPQVSATLRAQGARIIRAAGSASAATASQPTLLRSVDEQLALAQRWEGLARSEIGSGAPAGATTANTPAREAVLTNFSRGNDQFQALLSGQRARLQASAWRRAIIIALALSMLILLASGALLRGLGRVARRADARLRALIDSSLDLITVVDGEGGVLYQSPAVATMLGYRTPTPVGTPIAHLLHAEDAPRVLSAVRRAQSQDGAASPVECRWRHCDGSFRWLETVCNNLLGDPKVAGIVLTSRDVTERRELGEQLRERAFHDPLTGLANRTRLEDRLTRALGRAGTAVAVLFVDLDNFKTVNDSLGHAAGDRFLEETARRLTACVRGSDTVARMGGDEFAVLLVGLDASLRAPRVAERILQGLAGPVELESRVITPGASVGIAYSRSDQSAQDILRDADLALYAAKRAGKGKARVYEPYMHVAALHKLELEADLRLALERDELRVHYQPLFRLTDGELVGYEALVRWQHPSQGLLLPDTFIELAEQTGLIVPLTRWTLQAACAQTASWQAQCGRPLEVAVNLSFISLQDDSVVADVTSALQSAGIAAHDLVLEVTESTVTRDRDEPSHVLHDLKRLGVRLALDDFGTGHSSLSRLSQLPFDSLKIPRPFIERITYSQSHFALTQGIVDLGHRLGLSVVAEGIESSMQLARVRAIGCERAQGFHLARPAAATNIRPGEACPLPDSPPLKVVPDDRDSPGKRRFSVA